MLKFCVSQWDKNKHKLKSDIIDNMDKYQDCGYKYLVEKVAELVLNNEEDHKYQDEKFNYKGVTEIDNGDYQGTLLYLIPFDTYQPSEDEYLMTHVSYGSCSGCDTLQSIQMHMNYGFQDNETKEAMNQSADDIMTLCLHLIQNTIKPYKGHFDDIEDNDYTEVS